MKKETFSSEISNLTEDERRLFFSSAFVILILSLIVSHLFTRNMLWKMIGTESIVELEKNNLTNEKVYNVLLEQDFKDKQKKDEGNFFLCHNRSPRIHRYGLLCLLKKYEILDADVNWSLVGGYSFNNQKFLFKDIFNIDDVLDLTKEIEYFTSIEIKKSNCNTCSH